MTPDPRITPLVRHALSRTWLVVPCLTGAGDAIDITVPLDLAAATRLAAGAAAGANHLVEHASREQFLAAEDRPDIHPLSTRRSPLSD